MQHARALFYAKRQKCVQFLQIATFGHPFGRTATRFAGESAIEDLTVGETALLRNVLHFHIRLLGHQSFRLLDTIAGNELVETTAVFSVDELAQIRAINRQHTLQIDETQIRIQVGFLLLHP